jgi:hypothetical protein
MATLPSECDLGTAGMSSCPPRWSREGITHASSQMGKLVTVKGEKTTTLVQDAQSVIQKLPHWNGGRFL